MSENRFITFEQAGTMLGGDDRPMTREMLNRLIREGALRDNGLLFKARRVSRKSVLDLLNRMEEGVPVCPPREKAQSMKRQKVRGETAVSGKTRAVGVGAGPSRSATDAKSLADEWRTLMRLPTGEQR